MLLCFIQNVHQSILLQRYKTITDCILFLIKHPKNGSYNAFPTFSTEVYVSFFLSVPVKCMSISSHMCQWSVWYNTKGFLQPIPLLCMIFKFCQWCGRAGFSFKSFFHMFLTLKFQYCLYLVFFMGCLCLILKLFLEKGYKAMQKISTWYELYCIHAII